MATSKTTDNFTPLSDGSVLKATSAATSDLASTFASKAELKQALYPNANNCSGLLLLYKVFLIQS